MAAVPLTATSDNADLVPPAVRQAAMAAMTPAATAQAQPVPTTVAPANAPATAPAPAPSVSPAPPAQSQPVPTTAAPGQDQASQQTPPTRLFIDPRPYASLAESAPQYRAVVDRIAEQTGVSPQRLALTWAQEGGFRTQVPDGKAGERGPLQVLPSTAQQYDPHGDLDPNSLEGSMTTAGRIINAHDTRFGKDTPASVGAYQGGAGSVMDMAAHPELAEQNHPNTLARIRASFPGQQVGPGHMTGALDMDPKTLVDAAASDGPSGALRYIAQTAKQANLPMSDALRAAEATLVGLSGSVEGAQHARDYFTQISQAGANENLMAAHKALLVGNGAAAAQYLAKAHAYVPDGSMGSFGVDNKGQVWGQQMDEQRPGTPLGPRFQVDADGVMNMLNQTQDPAKYMQMVQAQQNNVASIRHSDAMGDYYGNLLASRQQTGAAHDAARVDVAGINAGAKTDAANTGAASRLAAGAAHDTANTQIGAGHDTASQNNASTHANATTDVAGIAADARLAGRRGVGPSAAMSRQVDKEAAANYSEEAMPDTTPTERGDMAETFHAVRTSGMTEPRALDITQRLHSGKLDLVQGKDGSWGVMDPGNKTGKPLAILPQDLGDRLAGGANPSVSPGAVPGTASQTPPPVTTPVGAGAAGGYARGSGMSNDISGTVQTKPQPVPTQSAAMPVKPNGIQ